jgi:two-component system response regulator (stage 0 sporulation protein F)
VLKVLIVDDQKGIQQMLQAFFEIEGYETVTANNGSEAVEWVKKGNIDLVIMDVKMPIMGGIEALKDIRKINPQLPVIMMTAYAEFNQKSTAQKLGIIDWLYKPLDIELLKEIVRNIFHEKEKNIGGI